MRTIFKSGLPICLAASLWLGGCTQSPPAEVTDAKVYTVYKHKISVTPPKGWTVREERSSDVPSTATPAVDSDVAAVVFEPPSGYGHIAVTATDGIKQTQDFMNQLANGIQARQGKIVKQWYDHKLNDPDPKNAYHMEFELKDAGPAHPIQKGMQVQIFTSKNVLYSLVFTAEPKVYDDNRATFLALVKSFELAP